MNHKRLFIIVALVLFAVISLTVIVLNFDVVKRINYAIDYELGVAHLCDGTDTAYEVHHCKYDYSEWLK